MTTKTNAKKELNSFDKTRMSHVETYTTKRGVPGDPPYITCWEVFKYEGQYWVLTHCYKRRYFWEAFHSGMFCYPFGTPSPYNPVLGCLGNEIPCSERFCYLFPDMVF